MHQNQHNQRYRELREGDPTRPQAEPGQFLFTPCLTVHWDNGEEMTFYYPFLMSVKLFLPGDNNVLELRFTSERLILKGYALKPLKRLFAQEKPSDIYVCKPRYVVPESISQPVVIEAIVEERKS